MYVYIYIHAYAHVYMDIYMPMRLYFHLIIKKYLLFCMHAYVHTCASAHA